jgi:transglutaminase-like putative cysteine protease
MLYQVTHTTRYTYEAPVSHCLNEVRLTPRSLPGQQVFQTDLRVQPLPAFFQHRKDYFDNDVTTFEVFEKHDRMVATATSTVEVLSRASEAVPSFAWEGVCDLLATPPDAPSLEALEFVFDSPYVSAGPELWEYARQTFTAGRPFADALKELSHRIHTEFEYQPKSTSIDMPLMDVLRRRRGVCQDFAHIMVGALRSLRLAARYVSGYVRSGVKYQGAEASHAWVSVFVPGCGWLSFDPTNDLMPSESHVTLAWGRDYGDVTPVKGITLGGGGQTVEVEVRVRPTERPSTPPGSEAALNS